MKSKLITIPSTGESISYYDLADLDIQNRLKKLNTSDNNVLYCSCNGTSKDHLVKMMTRGLNEDHNYILANYPNAMKHHTNCPKHTFEFEIASKGRIFKVHDNYLPINVITSGPNKQLSNDPSSKYTNLFGLGEYILSKAHNDYCNTYNKTTTSGVIFSELFEYYHGYCNGEVKSPLHHFIVNNSDGDIYVNDIIFNPKWISCDKDIDKTSSAIKNFRIINKKLDKPKSITKEYILLKYIDFEDTPNNQVKIKLYTKGKNTKANFDKYIYAYMDKDLFLNTLDMYSINIGSKSTDKYMSALVYVKNHTLIIDEFAIIHTYPNYCIPINSFEDLEVLESILKMRNKLLIYPIAKLDSSYDKTFNSNIPDYLVKNIETNSITLIEIFNKYSNLYYQTMYKKTSYYELLCSNQEYEFLGYYKNLGWKLPPMNALLFKKFKTLEDITKKVKFSLNKYKYKP